MYKRAFTMVEMLVTMVILVVMLGTLTVAYGHITFRTATAIAKANVVWQAKSLSKYIEHSVSHSVGCSTQLNGTAIALECDEPATGTTTDAFGVYNAFTPSSVDSAGAVHWGLGKRRYFFWSDSTGSFTGGLTPTNLWMAEQSASGLPLLASNIQGWTYYGASTTNYRWPYIDTFTFSVNAANHTVTYTIGASDWVGTDKINKTPTTGQQPGTSSVTITRTVYWRGQQ